ncbi:hypothetical protein NQ317_005341 [Molorchus minor]|uniref:RWD domain-containing protein n=1 Tax=Molorchus minor TaxID=1323400 RepID=A0ABQ9IUP4_9CUCU|nr:hypothetical protein NQ317_005341 [Molorchus minor]
MEEENLMRLACPCLNIVGAPLLKLLTGKVQQFERQCGRAAKENLDTQLVELESLQSVFYNPGEIRVEDLTTLSDMKNYVCKKFTYVPQYLDLTIKVLVDELKFELCLTLPHEYPHVQPEIFVRNHTLNREGHVQLNKDLCEYVAGVEKGEPCIFSAVSWLQDNAQNMWPKTKRREIVDLANPLLHISGFCMPGESEGDFGGYTC